jgi:esterase/lipase superfamily enzyme
MNKATIFFATNRNPIVQGNKIVDYGDRFNPIHPHELRFGYVETDNISIEGDEVSLSDMIRAKLCISTYAERIPQNGKPIKLGSQALFKDIAVEMSRKVPTLVFVHGYANSFRDAVTAAIVLQEKLRTDGLQINVILFTWPSDGSNLYKAYFDDRCDASASGIAFVRGFMKLRDFLQGITKKNACNQPIHLLCHSMGNYVLEKTLREINTNSAGRFPRIFDEIILAAADVDYDAFEYDYKFSRLPEIGKRVNVYFNRGDKALIISDWTKSNPDRLGHKGPRKPLDVPSGVVLLDCTEVVQAGLTGSEHAYFLQDRVRSDIVAALNGTREDVVTGRKYVTSANTYVLDGQHTSPREG